ncbi:unnamed protein product [Spirodela intermedia]|uniref:Uncharacterized protein n=1 Tax=Spirodela intermedia TaxID=51605 RepID=A0A7I8LDI8_SPIIN|nr:unnamed protein product [Spirodela intermedia]
MEIPRGLRRGALQPGDHIARRRRRHESHPVLSLRHFPAGAPGNDVEGVEALRLRLPPSLADAVFLVVLHRWESIGGTHRPRDGRLEPARFQKLRHRDSGLRIGIEQPGDQAAGLWREPRRALEASTLDLPVHGDDVGVLEGEESREQDEEDDAAGPEVGHGAVVAFLPEDLRCHVGRSTAGSVEEAVGAEVVGEGAETKVGNLETSSAVEKEVLGLQIPVVDAAGMAEIDSGDELPEVLARDLHGEVDLRLGGHHLVELHDVRVSNHLHHGDLPLHLLHHPGLDHLLLADHLHGYAPAAADVPREVDFPEGAMAEETPHLVLALEDNNLATGGHRWRRDLLHRRRSKNQRKRRRIEPLSAPIIR